MIQIILLILILLLPIQTHAAYKIHLLDGSVISGVGFYEKKGRDVALHFKDGSMWVPAKDIVKIEETESVEQYIVPRQEQTTQEIITIASPEEPVSDEIARMESLRSDVESLNEEIRQVNLEEARLITKINEINTKPTWNQYQVLAIEEEVKPYTEELRAVQQKKIELLEKKGSLENELKELTQR
jgi:chromosome segregation ATPase